MSFNALAAALLFLVASSGALGQASTRSDPGDPQSAVAPVPYESVFRGYRPFSDEKVVSWRATNDLVQKLGGWQAFARDKVPDIPPVTAPAEESSPPRAPETAPAQRPASKAPITPQPAAKPGGHAGHQ